MDTAAEIVWEWWEKALIASRAAGTIPPEAVESIIESSRRILMAAGADKRNADVVLFDIYTRIHWDWRQPTDRIFETLLEFELAEYFKERGLPA